MFKPKVRCSASHKNIRGETQPTLTDVTVSNIPPLKVKNAVCSITHPSIIRTTVTVSVKQL